MSQAKNEVAPAPEKKVATPGRQFRATCTQIATSLLTDWVGQDRASEAIGRVAVALSAAASASKKPEDFYDCTPESVGAVIAISALTGIMVGNTRNSLAYAIPRRQRKGEQPQLRYELSHRGVAALAKRSGQFLVPIPVSHADDVGIDENGEIIVKHIDIDNPPQTFEDLRGIVLLVKDLATNNVLFRGWVPKSSIEKRRNKSEGYRFALSNDWAQATDPWHAWPIEQSMKTAMHYAVSRGWCVIDDTSSIRALSVDSENSFGSSSVIIDAQPTKRINSLDSLTDRITGTSSEQQQPEQGTSEKETDETTKTEPPDLFMRLLGSITDAASEKEYDDISEKVDANWEEIEKPKQAILAEALKQASKRLGLK